MSFSRKDQRPFVAPVDKQHNKCHVFSFTQCRMLFLCLLVVLAGVNHTIAQPSNPEVNAWLEDYDVTWDVPGPTALESMPLGNGDIGVNVWVEPNGDLVFYIGKTDAWNQDVHGDEGLMKIGGVRVSLDPSPLIKEGLFRQTLSLRTGEIRITENEAQLRVWVDANNPVIRVEVKSPEPVSVKVSLYNWRKPSESDIIVDQFKDRLEWYHRNPAPANSHVANLTFGAAVKGDGLVVENPSTLSTSSPVQSQLISIHPLTAQVSDVIEWQKQLDHQINLVEAKDLETSRQAHQSWWDQFWHRSWIFVSGNQDAKDVTRGYVLQRFITACGGRGAYPIKFNGSIFTVENPEKKRNPDSRAWGGQYWFQNTRAMYWPRLMAGDFDMMLPLFTMYKKQLDRNAAQVQEFYDHPGAYFAETAPFWGGLKYWGPEVKEDWTGHYFTPILELSMMMLDYYEHTGDVSFAKETLVPVASEGLAFFDRHFVRDGEGKILLTPVNAIEMYWKVHNPAPDIAGLKAVLMRMMALPDDLVTDQDRKKWERLFSELPELPTGTREAKKVLLPYTGPQTARIRNGENPELYAVYPFRLYGIGKPDFQLAVDTYNTRLMKQRGCWVQDPIQAAMLGLTREAQKHVVFNLTRKEPTLKFPAFWEHANDYQPDQDNGGNGENGLQHMLMYADGKKIFLMPSWPSEWDCSFKLNVPYKTTVQGTIRDGKLLDLVVTPHERFADVIDLSIDPSKTK